MSLLCPHPSHVPGTPEQTQGSLCCKEKPPSLPPLLGSFGMSPFPAARAELSLCHLSQRVGVPRVRSSSLPELQCFISDSQLTRDAALHLGLGDRDVSVSPSLPGCVWCCHRSVPSLQSCVLSVMAGQAWAG